jgi:hypothetical protein
VDLSGVEGVTLAAWSNETVTLDGTIAVTGSWSLHTNGIYKTTLGEEVWQLWVDGEPMTVARFPNTETWSEQMWDRYDARRYEGAAGTNGYMVDNPEVGAVETLAGAGVSFNDCVAVLNTRNWTTYARLVENHVAGSNTFSYVPTADYKSTRAAYFMEGGVGDAELVMLDRPNEWAFDETNNGLYLATDDGLSPSGRTVRARNQDYFFSGTASSKNIVIDGFDFFGTTFSFYRSSGITVQNCRFRYPSFSKRVLGSLAAPAPTRFSETVDCTLYNCDLRYVDGPALYYKKAENTVIENNYFYMIDYGCLAEGYSLNGNATRGVVYRRNTLEITYNYHTRCGSQQTDGSSVQFSPVSVSNSVGRFNWFIDNERYSFRYDGDPGGHYGNFFRNVSRCPQKTAFRLKGDFHEIYNNTAVHATGDMNISLDKGGNPNSVSRNNAADKFTAWPIPGTADHNYNAQVQPDSMHALLRDPDNLDFRPRPGSALVDAGVPVSTQEGIDVTAGFVGAAPDQGAYEFGDTNYFIPGRIWPQASRPVPPSGAAGVKADADLMWLQGMDAASHNIYTGSSAESLGLQTNQQGNIFDPGELTPGSDRFWRVDTVLAGGGIVTGEVWSFRVESGILSSTNITLNPVADTYVDSVLSNGFFGSATTLDLRTPITTTVVRHGYLKFELPPVNGTISEARLQLYAGNTVSGGIEVFGVADTSWDEYATAWSNRPAMDAQALASGSVSGGYGEFLLSDYFSGAGTYSLGLVRGPKDSNRSVQSREAVNPPKLVLTVVEYDEDGDRMGDWWEVGYFGNIAWSDGTGDEDADGFVDYNEFAAGTDPTNAASRLVISELLNLTPTNLTLRWQSAADKSYRVTSRTNLLNGAWRPAVTNIAATPPVNTETVPRPADEAFFRVELE